MLKRNDFEYVKEYIESFGCKLVSNCYKNQEEKLEIIDLFGHLFRVSFDKFKFGNKHFCNECAISERGKKQRRNLEEIENFSKKYGAKLISKEYTSKKNKLLFLFSCGHEGYKSLDGFKLSPYTCPDCATNLKRTDEEIISIIKNMGYTILDEESNMENRKKRINIRDKEGYKFYSTIAAILNVYRYNYSLRQFHSSNPYTIDNINLRLKVSERNIKLLTKTWNSAISVMTWRCLNSDCLKEFNASWNDIDQGIECPFCSGSVGERNIMSFLKKNNMEYIYQYRIPECRNIKPLSFDFCVFPNSNKQLLIEFNGLQHEKPISYFGGNKEFNNIKIRDNIKIDYCRKNNLKLLIIPYKDIKEINRILSKELGLKT